MRDAFAKELTRLAGINPDIVLLSGDIGNRMFDELKNDIDTLENSHSKIPTVLQSAATLKERCYSSIDSLDTSYNMLLKAYREQNKMHRTEPVPIFFDQEYKIEKPELISFEVGEVKINLMCA